MQTVGAKWQKVDVPVAVGKGVDRVKIEFDVSGEGKVCVYQASWRLAR